MYTEITSRTNQTVQLAQNIARSAAERNEKQMFFAEGKKLCLDLAGRIKPLMLFFTDDVLEACPQVDGMGEENYLIMPHVAEKLSETKTSQGLFGVFPVPDFSAEDIEYGKGVLLCENIQDPTNVGAMLRTAAALGMGGVVLCGASADPYSPKAIRASMGAVGRIPLLRVKDVGEACHFLVQRGVTLYATVLQGAEPLQDIKVKKPFALLIGNEGAGLSETALDAAEKRVYLPMQNGVESLNAAVAAAVMMFYFSGM